MGTGLARRGEAGGDRKASELSQAEGHQGAALEFFHHSWGEPDVAFPDPAGPCLLGINMAPLPPTSTLHSRMGGEPCEEEDSLGAMPGLSFLTWKMSLEPMISPRVSGAGEQNRIGGPRTCRGDSSPHPR